MRPHTCTSTSRVCSDLGRAKLEEERNAGSLNVTSPSPITSGSYIVRSTVHVTARQTLQAFHAHPRPASNITGLDGVAPAVASRPTPGKPIKPGIWARRESQCDVAVGPIAEATVTARGCGCGRSRREEYQGRQVMQAARCEDINLTPCESVLGAGGDAMHRT